MPPFRCDGFRRCARRSTSPFPWRWVLCIFTFVMLSTSPTLREAHNLAADYLTRSLADAGGANAVNVIIVDFRAIDTNGRSPCSWWWGCWCTACSDPGGGRHDGGQPDPADRRPLRRASDRVGLDRHLPAGPQLPGGGFIAGVMAAAAGAMYLLAFGAAKASASPGGRCRSWAC